MSLTVRDVAHADETGRSVVEWVIENKDGQFVAGGYAATAEDANSDAACWSRNSETNSHKEMHNERRHR